MKVLAFDFGASSGRAVIGELKDNKISITEVHRFDNTPVYLNGGFFWDLPRLFYDIKQGIAKAKEYDFDCIGVDTWGVDYGLIAKDGNLLSLPYNYRDARCGVAAKKLNETISDEELYKETGIQKLDFNTIFQLYSDKTKREYLTGITDKLLLIPDLFNYLLTGEKYAETTIASTTQLLNPYTKEWDFELIKKAGLNENIFPKLIETGSVVGTLSDEIAEELNIEKKKVIAVASHDTASAVAAVPSESESFVYISSGTWSLFGTELKEPCISDMSMKLNIANETGYDKTTRFLKNIIGLWMIQETRRQFIRDGKNYSYADMEKLARETEPFKCFINTDDSRFVPPGNQVERIKSFCKETGQYVPQTDGEVIRCIYESLAMKYKMTFDELKECTGKDFDAIHVVGGGTKDNLLCQMTADATNTCVMAGPIEATAIGNIAVQLISMGEISDLKTARKIIKNSFDIIEYKPQETGFAENYARFEKIV